MRIVVLTCLLFVVLGSGCSHKKPKTPPGNYSALAGLPDTSAQSPTAAPARTQQQLIVTPENVMVGKVKRVNPTARFVVLSFPVGRLPAPDEQFSVYRGGLKVGEIKITNQQLNEYIVADIIDGEAEEGDEVRNK